MVNLADLDTSFLVPCRHCGDLLPEQDRICPHCGKDQALTLGPDGAEAVAGAHGVPPGDGDVLDSTFMARGGNDFARTGIGAVDVDDDGPARRRRKAIGIVALIAGVLLLGMAWDQYRKQPPSTPSSTPPSASSAPAQDAPRVQAQPSTATGPVVRTPSAPASAAVPPAPAPVATAAPPVAAAPPPTSARATPPAPPAPSAPSLTPARTAASPAPSPTPSPSPARTSTPTPTPTPTPPASSAPAGTTEAARPACDEALAAMSLCKP